MEKLGEKIYTLFCIVMMFGVLGFMAWEAIVYLFNAISDGSILGDIWWVIKFIGILIISVSVSSLAFAAVGNAGIWLFNKARGKEDNDE